MHRCAEVLMQNKIAGTILLLFSILLIGTLGFMLIEKWPFLNSLYTTVVTLATVGYGDFTPKSPAGKTFTIFLILSGMSLLLYSVTTITSFFVEGELSQVLRERKMLKKISLLTGHYIVCGVGKTGSYIVSELLKTKRDFVVIDKNKDVLQKYENCLCIAGDANDEEILKNAKIETADGLFAVLPTDEEILFLIITARGLNPNLKIVARGIKDSSAGKLRSAGANSIIQPNRIGGMRMVSEMVRPAVVSFLDKMLRKARMTCVWRKLKSKTRRLRRFQKSLSSGLGLCLLR